jgi:hypothetical protein
MLAMLLARRKRVRRFARFSYFVGDTSLHCSRTQATSPTRDSPTSPLKGIPVTPAVKP